MKIIGIQKRISNSDMNEIMQHWGTFFSESHREKLGLTDQCVAVYSNYENNEAGAFDLLLGGEGEMKEGYESIEIADTKYKEYTTSGMGPQVVKQLWEEIWNDNIDREFQTDYEVYSGNMQNPDISIFIGVKN